MNSDIQHIAKQIKQFRKERHISQEELAEKVFVSRNTISNIESGKTVIGVETLIAICEVLSVSIADFFPQRLSVPGQKKNGLFRVEREFEKVPDVKKEATVDTLLSVVMLAKS